VPTLAIPGLPLTVDMDPLTTILLIGGDRQIATTLSRAGVRVDRHALDTGPLAQLRGVPFAPPVTAWPFPDAAYDVVVLLDELALTVQEEAAIAEAARVLRPGGLLLLRAPAAGRLAWLDGYNAYRYVRDSTRRGRLLPETAGVGWRRHYRCQDLNDLLRPHFRVREMRSAGIGISEAVRLALALVWRWALRSQRGDAAIRRAPRTLARWEGNWTPGGHGYWLVAAAERLADGLQRRERPTGTGLHDGLVSGPGSELGEDR
jgi:SAM-dependent methyltransferase